MTKADMIELWLRSAVGCGYVYGATGWICSQSRREQQAAQYPEYEKTILTTCAKWDGKKCYDCAQLVKKAAATVGVTLPSGATSQWKSYVWADGGEIATAPEGKLICVFRESGGKMQHVGWRLRNGDVIDARGSAYGVVLNLAYKAGWTHWGLLPGLDNEVNVEEESAMTVGTVVGGRLKMRAAPSKDAPILAYLSTNTVVNVLEMGDEWCKVTHKSDTGYCMREFLVCTGESAEKTPAVQPSDDDVVTVTMPKALYEQLKALFA